MTAAQDQQIAELVDTFLGMAARTANELFEDPENEDRVEFVDSLIRQMETGF